MKKLESIRCLILEDEPGLLEDFSKCVKRLELKPLLPHVKTRFHVDSASSAAEAKELLRKASSNAQQYDVMLLDLSVPENKGMPDVEHGLKVLKIARDEDAVRSIVVVSGHREGMDSARSLGATNFISKKGFRLSNLQNAIADALGRGPSQLAEQFMWPGFFDALGRRIPENAPEHQQIRVDLASVSDEFLRKLQKNPRLIYEMSSRGFEELIADLLVRLEYKITLTPASKDGGKDIYAAKKDHLGTFLYIVECKKYAPDHPVGVGLIRQLNGVVQAEQATAGILATTSFFTRGAQEFQKTIAFQISLKDYFGIQDWLCAVLKM